MVICFLTDFGLQDDFVGTCHGVIARIAPDARVIDVTHGIPPTQVLQGALVLSSTLPYMPIGIHLAVVDPGVGGVRRPVALEDAEGRLFVGPDNGLLLPAAERAGITRARELVNPQYALETISRTFHGRDLFAPAAAWLSKGQPVGSYGRLLSNYARLPTVVPGWDQHVMAGAPISGDADIHARIDLEPIIPCPQIEPDVLQLFSRHVPGLTAVDRDLVEAPLSGHRPVQGRAGPFVHRRDSDVIVSGAGREGVHRR